MPEIDLNNPNADRIVIAARVKREFEVPELRSNLDPPSAELNDAITRSIACSNMSDPDPCPPQCLADCVYPVVYPTAGTGAAQLVPVEQWRERVASPEPEQRLREVEGGYVSEDAYPQAGEALKSDLARDLDRVAANRAELIELVERLVQERDQAQAFKAYVHKRLDEWGVPTHPEGVHSKDGCRIGDRLDLVEREHGQLKAINASLSKELREEVRQLKETNVRLVKFNLRLIRAGERLADTANRFARASWQRIVKKGAK